MNNEIKFEYIKRLWYLQDGIIYSRHTGKPVSFAGKSGNGRRLQIIKISGKRHAVYIHEAVFTLFHDRPVAEGKEIHHKDGNYENNSPENLIELTRAQHQRVHAYQCNDPMRGIYLEKGTWCFHWIDNGCKRNRRFHGINEAMAFRDEIERPRRQELRALGLQCKRVGSGEKPRRLYAAKSYFSRSNANL